MHIAIIMDGNRRWAKGRGVPTALGHKAGFEKLKEVISWCREGEMDVQVVTLYAFSTENWNRSPLEVEALMKLFLSALDEFLAQGQGTERISFIGERSHFPVAMIEKMDLLSARTSPHTGTHIVLALSYGGRAEILDAIRRIPSDKLLSISESDFSDLLWTSEIPDPDLILRTGGEQRLSNFLTWQSTYSELAFTETLWPDLGKDEFAAILEEYSTRERRRGV